MTVNRWILPALLAFAGAAAALPTIAWSHDEEDMMKKMARYTTPGAEHAKLEAFAGEWDITVKVWMGGAAPMETKGTASAAWVLGKRFIEAKGSYTLMGQAVEFRSLLGYDLFKRRYTTTMVNSWETAIRTAEGGFDHNPATPNVLHLYGTIDEYLDGTHDKAVRYTWRFPDADTIVMETHDLDIGEKGTKVVEVTQKRRK